MRAFRILEPMKGEVCEVDVGSLREDEVLVRVRACGICGTDLHIFKGEVPVNYPLIPGHEISGEVVSIGSSVNFLREGDRVAVNPNFYCRECYYCRRGLVHFCENWRAIGVHLPGGFAEYVKVPGYLLHRVPDSLSFEEAAFAEPIACCLHGIRRLGISVGDKVAVFGLGPIGLIHVQLAKSCGASLVIGVDLIEKRLRLAEHLGADIVLNASECNPVKEILSETQGRGVNKVIEATGNPVVLEQALEVIDFAGKILVFGVAPHEAIAKIRPYDIYRKEATIVGSFVNPFTTDEAIEVMSAKTLRVLPIISHVIGLQDIVEYFNRIMSKDSDIVKVIVKP